MNRRLGMMLVLATLLLGGCAAKRVTSSGVMTEEVPLRLVSKRTAPVASRPAPPVLPAAEPRTPPGTGAVEDPSPTTTALGPRAVQLARAQLGKPYQWGAAGPSRFDCSGLVQYVYSNLGVSLPRVSRQQASAGVHVDREDLKPGDLVFFTLAGSRIDHVGIYTGHGKFIHAPRKYSPVRVDSLHDSWWRRRFKGGRRVG